MLGVRQQQIISLLTARGGLCVEIVLQEPGGQSTMWSANLGEAGKG